MDKTLRWALTVVGILVLAACAFFPWLYTSAQLRVAQARGVYETPEQGMRSMLGSNYSPGADIKILHAGPNFRDGSRPMDAFHLAGPGESMPSTNWAPGQSNRFCQ